MNVGSHAGGVDKKRPQGLVKAAASAEHGDADGDDYDSDDEDVEEVFRTPMECQTIETGDSIKVKQVLDETVVETIMAIGFEQSYSWDNLKLLLMVVSCVFAMVAQFYPMPFPESRPLQGACCAGYFVLSGVLQFMITFVDKDTIMTTAGATELQIDTTFHRFQEYFTFMVVPVKNSGPKDAKATCAKMYVGRYFTEMGDYDQVGFALDIEKLMIMHKASKYGDVADFEGPVGGKKKDKSSSSSKGNKEKRS